MGYTALLFCPEEKTARTVTQVLSELEFTVEACSEPFAAVKKLMGQHFDAVVVDCDNEQNATLLFKSARNSASNQTSLAVAVVEGQAGVAKAFRIGANLVLTKPINIEQAKGTLRVARGLLRKSEPGKTAASAATAATPAAVSPVVPKAIPEAKPKPVEPATPVFAAQPAEVPSVKPTPAWSAAAASTKPAAADDDLLDIELDKPNLDKAEAKPAPGTANVDGPILPSEIFAARGEGRAMFAGGASIPAPGGGAASAAAPAREEKVLSTPQSVPGKGQTVSGKAAVSDDDDVLETSSGSAAPTAVVGFTPSFTLGGASGESESSGGSKKIIIGIAAALVVGAGLYFGWSHFQGSAEQTTKPQAPVSMAAPNTQPAGLSAQPPAAKPSAAPVTEAPASLPAASKEQGRADQSSEDRGSKAAAVSPAEATQSAPAAGQAGNDADNGDNPETAPLMVKGGKAPEQNKVAAADTPAPSLAGMATAEAAPPNFVPTDGAFKPTLQRLNVSQGVSQGLLIKKVPPSYPPVALRMRIEGQVELLATISKDGDISQVKVLSGDPQLTKAATTAVKQWKYKPYLLNGEPVEIQTQITVNFKLPE
jgi:TonB family protein